MIKLCFKPTRINILKTSLPIVIPVIIITITIVIIVKNKKNRSSNILTKIYWQSKRSELKLKAKINFNLMYIIALIEKIIKKKIY